MTIYRRSPNSLLVHQQRLQRFRRDLQNAGGVLEQLVLMGLGHVAVPVPHGDLRLRAQVVEAAELVVDERLQRADIDRAHGGGRVLIELGQNREEGGLRFAGGGGGAQQQVVVGVEDHVPRRHLHGP